MKRTIAITLLLASTLTCCKQDKDKKGRDALISNTELHKQMVARIDSLETRFYNDSLMYDPDLHAALLQEYTEFARLFVGDKVRTPAYMYKAGALSRSVGLPLKALKLYDQILIDYPTWERCPEVAFLIAFTYDEDIKDRNLAREAYEDLIRRYPDDHWSVQAKYRLETIDMTDEEMIEHFMRKEQQAS